MVPLQIPFTRPLSYTRQVIQNMIRSGIPLAQVACTRPADDLVNPEKRLVVFPMSDVRRQARKSFHGKARAHLVERLPETEKVRLG